MGQFFRRFVRDTRANVLVITSVAALPLLYVVGVGVDYGNAAARRAQLDAYADAAALAAVTPAMASQSNATVIAAAKASFNAQVASVTGINYSANNLSVTVQNGATQTVTVAYTATSQNLFPTLLGQPTIAIAGSASATVGLTPNIDFYLLLDNSPSMAIAATQAGINTMVNNTGAQGGCAFGCHETHPSSDNLGNPNGEDNYTLARNLGVTLRIDLLNQAAQNLMTTATNTMAASNGIAHYRAAIYTFDTQLNTIQTLTSNLATAKTAAQGITMLTVYANNYLTKNNQNSDTDTNYDAGMSGINGVMPNPGSGTNIPGDPPQEVLFFVTDGVEDESSGGNRVQSLMSNGWCTTIKNRGIRIAVLYTEYLPLPTNAWYNQYIAPFQPNIGTTLQNCASPGLYTKVQTGGDISAALSNLFSLAVQSAYLSR